eukprot:361775-Chlamydomonas_euryale.AAC.8
MPSVKAAYVWTLYGFAADGEGQLHPHHSAAAPTGARARYVGYLPVLGHDGGCRCSPEQGATLASTLHISPTVCQKRCKYGTDSLQPSGTPRHIPTPNPIERPLPCRRIFTVTRSSHPVQAAYPPLCLPPFTLDMRAAMSATQATLDGPSGQWACRCCLLTQSQRCSLWSR